MGFLDKMKQAAGEAAEAAKKGTAGVQAKVEQSQLRKRADEAAKKLGYLVYQERAAGTPVGQEGDQLVAEIAGLEKNLAEMAKQPEQEAGGSPAGSEPPPSPEGAS